MTHTLHRVKTRSGQTDDYVVLIMPARGINNQNSVEIFKKYLDLMAQFDPVNMGAIGCGNFATHTLEEIKANLKPEVPLVHGVFDTRDKLIEVMKALKEADYGYSVVVSGLVDDVDCCAKAAGINRHSVDISLGIWGNVDKLPETQILEITTMCGHAMISAGLVTKMVEDIKAGRRTAKDAANELSKPCACGIFNPHKAERLLLELAEKL